MIKRYFLFLFVGFASHVLAAQCPEGNVSLTSQDEVIAFVSTYPDCTEITGSLFIGRTFTSPIPTDISSLTGLAAITSVGGNLVIQINNVLTSLSGLDAITSVGGYLDIFANTALTSLSGLGAITSISGDLFIQDNAVLINLSGLGAITSVEGKLNILSNGSLNSLDGLDALILGGGPLDVRFNPQLSNCAVQSFCTYLGVPDNAAMISDNATGCDSREEVLMACNAGPLAVTEITRTNIQLFPNPTTALLELRNAVVQSVTVFNAQGQRVADYSAPGSTLDLGDLPTGFYYLSILRDEGRFSAQVVKVN